LLIPSALITSGLSILAQTAPTSAPTSQPAPWYMTNPLLMPILLAVALMFFLSRSKKSQDKQREQALSAMKRNDRVQTIGGILGTVIEVREGKVLVKVDENSNTKIWFARSAIHKVLGEDGAETK